MELEKYIISLLQEKDYFVIPELGAFITQKLGADIHPVTHKFSPPSKKIAFNSQLLTDDGILITKISEGENISKEEAALIISSFVNSVKSALESPGFYEIKDAGRFFKNLNGELEFESNLRSNLLEESFGLPEMIFKPIERNSMNTRAPKKSAVKEEISGSEENSLPKKRNLTFIWAMLPLFVLVGAGAFLYANKNNDQMKAKFPFSLLFGKTENVITAEVPVLEEPIVEEMPIEEPVVEEIEEPAFHEVAVSGKRGAYSIIIGSFKKESNALKLKNKIEKDGASAVIIEPTNTSSFYRVSIAEFNEKEAAITSLNKYRSQYGNGTWVMPGQ